MEEEGRKQVLEKPPREVEEELLRLVVVVEQPSREVEEEPLRLRSVSLLSLLIVTARPRGT